ncbi:MAG: hypothetical protein KC431_31370, partial [Myxococcales bacterium]|nr:hypothetical protein [Myxococcales bacterium]
DELGVARHTLLETFNPSLDALALARARLGLSKSMTEALTGGQGFSTLDSWDGKNAAALTSIALVLETSGHSFEELEVILRASFVGAGLSMSCAAFPDDCDLQLASITGLTDAHLERWHRFVRLQRALGLGVHELDVALRTLAPTPGSLDDAFLQRLGAARVIGERLKLDDLGLYELWSDIDVVTPPEDPQAPSRYASAFLRRALLPDPEASNFALDQGGELSDTALPMTDDSRLSVAKAALGASSGELSLLVEWLSTLGMAADTTTTLAILSAARRRISLARALGISLASLRRLISVTRLDPFHDAASIVDMAGLQRTLDFLDAARLVLDSGFSVEALDYILFHESPDIAGIELDAEASRELLARLDGQLAGLFERYAVAPDPTGARLRDALAEYLPPTSPADPAVDVARLDALMAIIAGTSSADDAAQNGMIATELGAFLTD